jgi:hypothetical protein
MKSLNRVKSEHSGLSATTKIDREQVNNGDSKPVDPVTERQEPGRETKERKGRSDAS